jgi:hypothetical protein
VRSGQPAASTGASPASPRVNLNTKLLVRLAGPRELVLDQPIGVKPQGRGALKRELVWCLRTGRALRAPRERTRRKTWAHVTPETLISERPAEAEDRAVPGHWEGDLLIGLQRSAIGTVVERTTRFTMLVHLPREEGYRHKETPKNGPALAGYGAITMKNA